MTLLLLVACLGPVAATDPPSLLAAAAQDFRDHYALFPAKDLDWDAHVQDQPALAPDASDADLHAALVDLLAPLNDNHVHLLVPEPTDPGAFSTPDWTSGVLHDLDRGEDFSLEQTLDLLDRAEQPHPMVAWGQVDDVGYVWVGSLSDRDILGPLDDALAALESTDALILDLRHNGGGLDAVYQAVAARFVSGAPRYGRFRLRASAQPGDFTDWSPLQVAEADGPVREGPVVVLQHRFTVSAAEGLLLALAERPETTFVGHVSSGAFGTVWWRELANGWLYSLTVSDVRDVDGASWEGVGLAPDVPAQSTLDDLRAGQDRALDAALDVLTTP